MSAATAASTVIMSVAITGRRRGAGADRRHRDYCRRAVSAAIITSVARQHRDTGDRTADPQAPARRHGDGPRGDSSAPRQSFPRRESESRPSRCPVVRAAPRRAQTGACRARRRISRAGRTAVGAPPGREQARTWSKSKSDVLSEFCRAFVGVSSGVSPTRAGAARSPDRAVSVASRAGDTGPAAPLLASTVATLRRPSAGAADLGRHCGDYLPALQRSAGIVALSRHCGDYLPALRRLNAGAAATLGRRCGAQPALRRPSDGAAAMRRHCGQSQPDLRRSAGTAATLGWHRSGQPLRVAHRRSTGRRQAALYMNLAVRVARPHFAATGCLPTARQVPC